MALVTLHNRHSAPIDGVLPGASGEFEDGPGVRRMVEIGHLSVGAPSASAAPAQEFNALVAKLEAENAALRAELEASKAKAPKAPKTPPAEG